MVFFTDSFHFLKHKSDINQGFWKVKSHKGEGEESAKKYLNDPV